MSSLAIVTMLWNDPRYRRGQPYGREHVDRLASAVDRHLTIPHHHVCMTAADDHTNPDRPVREVPFLTSRYDAMGGCWRKLQLFSAEIGSLLQADRFLYLDLDTVVCGDLTSLVEEKADIALLGCQDRRTTYNTSLILMNVGARTGVWNAFTDHPVRAVERCALSGMIGDDQVWASLHLLARERIFDDDDGVLFFNENMRELPDEARVVCFPGPPDPSQPALQRQYPWIARHWR